MPSFHFAVIVSDPVGLHARPAGQLVELVQNSGLVVRIGRTEEDLVPASSPLRVMALKAKHSQELVVEIEAADHGIAQELARRIQAVLGSAE